MNQSLALLSSHTGRFPVQTQLAQRFVLYRGELYRVPPWYGLLRVAAGMAYVTQAGQDHLVPCGQEFHLSHSTDPALVSAIDGEQVIVELFNIRN
jgi:hypothetical protein